MRQASILSVLVLVLSGSGSRAQAQAGAPSLPSPVGETGTAEDAPETADAPPPAPLVPSPEVEPVSPPAPYFPQPAPDVDASGYAQGPTAYAAGPTLSGTPSPLGGPGAREHDGFFLRLTVGTGAGFMSYRESIDGVRTEDVSTGGVAFEMEAAVGGRVVGNLLVHANLLLSSVNDANKTVSGVKNASDTTDSRLVLLGGGLTYYFMPYNVYVSGMLGVGQLSETRDGERALRSGAGIGGALMVGTEWWAGPRAEWGLGAALRGTLLNGPVTIGGIDSRLNGSQITIVFSATYN